MGVAAAVGPADLGGQRAPAVSRVRDRANQPPAPPMISGPIFAVIAGAVLLVDRERFNAPQPSAS